MNHPPIVSVCVQTYNHKDYIKECLDGILMQETTFPIEIILGDDVSNDGTHEICLQYQTQYPSIIKLQPRQRSDVIYINNRPTGRYNFVQNLMATTGKFIALCEGDDYWLDKNKLQAQYELLQDDSDSVMCFHNAYIQQNDNKNNWKLYGNSSKYQQSYSFQELVEIGESIMPTASLFFRRPTDLHFPEWFNRVYAGDYALILLLCKHGHARYLDQPMSVYRKTSQGASKTHDQMNKILSRIYLLTSLRQEVSPDMYASFDEVLGRYMLLGGLKYGTNNPLSSLNEIWNRLRPRQYQITKH